jgi:hypothetical protein
MIGIEIDFSLSSLQKVCREKEEKMVAHDILRLQLKRLQDILSLRAGQHKLVASISFISKRGSQPSKRNMLHPPITSL